MAAVVVTGAATGIGAAVVDALLARGDRVVAVERPGGAPVPPRAGVAVIAADLSREADIDAIAPAALRAAGQIDGLVNAAGLHARGGPLDAPLSVLDRLLAVNLLAPLRLIRALCPALRERRGAVVNVTSVAAAVATPGRCYYAISKAALAHATRALARELAPEVRINAVAPGPVMTPMLEAAIAEDPALGWQLLAATPMRRFAAPAEIASWIVHLLGDAGAWVTGTTLHIDGGRTT